MLRWSVRLASLWLLVLIPLAAQALGLRVADHGWGLGYMLNQRGVAGPNLRSFGHGGSGGSYGFVDLEHGIGYAYVMNYFDATKCNADPRTTALSDAVYRVLGVL